MPFFIFNQNDKQRADFYESQITDVEILWQGESVDAFTAETGFNIDQLGGFKLDNKKKLKFDQALKDAFDNPPPPPLSLEQKRLMLIDSFKGLAIDTRVAFQAVAVNVDSSLRLGDVELAVANLETAKTVEGANIELLQNMIDLINS
jgi:hypothetical protein